MKIALPAGLNLCPHCRELVHVRPNFKLCDPCELAFIKIWQQDAIFMGEIKDITTASAQGVAA